MSLSRSLLNGNYDVDTTLINPAKYTAECGAHVIAMESVAELHEIFLEDYNYEQADLAAISEGVELEGSRYEAVAEASVKGAFEKIKAFFKKLWEKIKAFFHNIVRWFDSIFKSGKEFATKYKKDIDNMGEVKDLVMSIHKFNDKDIDSFAGNLKDYLDGIDKAETSSEGLLKDIREDFMAEKSAGAKLDDYISEFKKEFSSESVYKKFSNNKADNLEDFKKVIVDQLYANGISDASEVDITTSMVKDKAKILVSATKPNYASLQSKIDSTFKKIDNAIKQAEDATARYTAVGPKCREVLSALSTFTSASQSCLTAGVTVHKSVWAKRDAEYKHIIVSGLSHAKKK